MRFFAPAALPAPLFSMESTRRACGAKSSTAAAVFAELSDLLPWMADGEVRDPSFFERLDVHRSRVERSDGRAARGNDAQAR